MKRLGTTAGAGNAIRLAGCRPAWLLRLGDEVLIVQEDLDASGFAKRRAVVTDAELQACLSWLANFHATFIGEQLEGLWPTGTYWHLATHPDELAVLSDTALKNAAETIFWLMHLMKEKDYTCQQSIGKNR